MGKASKHKSRGRSLKFSGGGYNWKHMYAADKQHLSDHEKALLQAGGREARKFQRLIERLAKKHFNERDPEAWARMEAHWEAKKAERSSNRAAPGEPGKVRFPGIGHGISTIRTDLIAGSGEPTFHVCSTEEFRPMLEKLGDWYSCYKGTRKDEPQVFFDVREQSRGLTARDGRFAYATATVPKWDTDSIQASVEAGELPADIVKQLCAKMDQWGLTEGQKYFSAGAEKQLLYSGGDAHLDDGSIHYHLRLLKASRSGYRRADGTLEPRSKAPKRGRPRAGEGWEAGERLGLVAANGHLALNTLGPAMCAADALREEGFQPPLMFRDLDDAQGTEWALHKRAIQRRTEGGFSYVDKKSGKTVWVPETGVRAGPDGHGIGVMPGDMMASRYFRQLVRELAERVPAFKVRRDALIAKAKADEAAVERDLMRLFAGDELARRDLQLDAATGKIRDLERDLESTRQSIEAERIRALEATVDVVLVRLESLKKTLRGETLSADELPYFVKCDGVWIPNETQRQLAVLVANHEFAGMEPERAGKLREAAKLFGELAAEQDALRERLWELTETEDPEGAAELLEEAQREWTDRFPGPVPMMPVHVAHEMVAATEAEAVEAIEELSTQATTRLAETEAEASIQIERAKVDAFKLVLGPMIDVANQVLSWFRGLKKSGDLSIDARRHFVPDEAATFGHALNADWARFLDAVDRNPAELRGKDLKPLLELQRENEAGRHLDEIATAVALVRAGRQAELSIVQRGFFADDGELVDAAYGTAAATRVRLVERRVVPDAILQMRLDALRGIESWTRMPPVERAAIWHGAEKPAPLREVQLPDNVVKFPNQKGA